MFEESDRLESVLNRLSELSAEQKKVTDVVTYNKRKIDDIFSMMHNKSLQINVCTKEVKEMKATCNKLRKEMGELKFQVFDCRKAFKASEALPHAPVVAKQNKKVHWADEHMIRQSYLPSPVHRTYLNVNHESYTVITYCVITGKQPPDKYHYCVNNKLYYVLLLLYKTSVR